MAPAVGSRCFNTDGHTRAAAPAPREELYKATSAGEEQQLRGARGEEHAAELRRGRDDLRRRLVELGAEHHAAVLPQLEVCARLLDLRHSGVQVKSYDHG